MTTRSRREFIGTGAALVSLASAGTHRPAAQTARPSGHRWDESCAWMKLSLAYFHAGGVRGRPERVGMARQMGVLGGVGGAGVTSRRPGRRTRRWGSSGRCSRAST